MKKVVPGMFGANNEFDRRRFLQMAASGLGVLSLEQTLRAAGMPLWKRRSEDPGNLWPGVVRRTGNVFLMENHSTAYLVWHALGVRNATVVHLDTHDDFRFVAPEKSAAARRLADQRAYAELFRLSDLSSYFQYKVSPADCLYDLGNFLYPCVADGAIAKLVWIVAQKRLEGEWRRRLERHLQGVLKLASLPSLQEKGDAGFSFRTLGAEIVVTTLDGFQGVDAGALLDFDVDFFVFPRAVTDRHLMGKLMWDPSAVCRRVRRLVANPAVTTVCASVWGGYLPLMFRFLADACFEYFATGEYPVYAEDLLRVVTELRTQRSIVPLPGRPEGQTFEPAFEHLRALVGLMKGRDAEGMKAFKHAAALRPVYRKGLLDASEAFLYSGRVSRAHEALDRFQELTGCGTSSVDAARIRVLLKEGRLGKADALSKRLVDWDPCPHFLMLRGGALTEQGKFKEASAIYADVIRKSPRNGKAYYNKGITLERQGERNKAVEAYRIAVKLRPDFADAEGNLGHLLLQEGRLDEAVRHLKRAADINPLNVTTLNNLGLALFRKRQPLQALPFFQGALRVNSGIAEAHLNLALALAESGQRQKAIKHGKRAVELKPGWEQAATLLKELESQ